VTGNAVVMQFLLESWNELFEATIFVGSTVTRHQLSETPSRNSILNFLADLSHFSGFYSKVTAIYHTFMVSQQVISSSIETKTVEPHMCHHTQDKIIAAG
jgi:hypothetical protein